MQSNGWASWKICRRSRGPTVLPQGALARNILILIDWTENLLYHLNHFFMNFLPGEKYGVPSRNNVKNNVLCEKSYKITLFDGTLLQFSRQCFGSGYIESGSGPSIFGWIPIPTNPDPGFLWPKSINKIPAEKNVLFFWIKTCNLHIPRPP
jgi:hypothetical protein